MYQCLHSSQFRSKFKMRWKYLVCTYTSAWFTHSLDWEEPIQVWISRNSALDLRPIILIQKIEMKIGKILWNAIWKANQLMQPLYRLNNNGAKICASYVLIQANDLQIKGILKIPSNPFSILWGNNSIIETMLKYRNKLCQWQRMAFGDAPVDLTVTSEPIIFYLYIHIECICIVNVYDAIPLAFTLSGSGFGIHCLSVSCRCWKCGKHNKE